MSNAKLAIHSERPGVKAAARDGGVELARRLLKFAASVVKLVDRLPKTTAGRHIAGQLIRSGTSPGANYEEARAAESRADFAHKLGIVLKELKESRFWLHLALESGILPDSAMKDVLSECNQLCAIIAKSVPTTRSRR